MLVFITTDADIETAFLTRALESAVQSTFNSITVDGDSSTNDTVLMMANGAADAAPITGFSGDYFLFHSALEYVCMKLAEMIVRDGEGATKLVRVHVDGADDAGNAKKIAKTVANSLLVKTAIFGNDPNWGRIIAAAGRAGVAMDPDLVDIYVGDLAMLKSGNPEKYDEAKAKEILKQKEIDIRINLHMGSESATVLTCDISYDYVKINADYHT
jgi:glutamate N-acetyltransferase/amino-acid N-acetyltransferase